MTGELDPNAIVAQFLAIKIDDLLEKLSGTIKNRRGRAQALLRSSYERYLTSSFERFLFTKSFFYREEPVSLYHFYVPLSLGVAKKRVTAPGAKDVIALSSRVVVTAAAGSGKSVFMRHLFLDSVASSTALPVFVQLRDVQSTKSGLKGALVAALADLGANLPAEHLEEAFKSGGFVFLLDGFDEIPSTARSQMAGQISHLGSQYPNCSFIVSSRPDSAFGGWTEYMLVELLPLVLDEACTLVEKLPGDEHLRMRFIKDLKEGLFEKHEDFLSNPLLLSMMLLTYGEMGEVPDKLSTFYSQAYDTLFLRHDALKRGFKRERVSGLDIQDFARVLSAFSLLSYDRRIVKFPHAEGLKLARRASVIAKVPVAAEAFLADCLQAVCLLLEDGLDVAFAHRSFQEYFTALFIAEAPSEQQNLLIKKYSDFARRDAVFSLLYEICPDPLDEHFFLPGLSRLRERLGIKAAVGITHYTRFLKLMYEDLRVMEDGDVHLLFSGGTHEFDFLLLAVRTVFRRLGLKLRRPDSKSLREQLRGVVPGDDGDTIIHTQDLTYRSPIVGVLFENGGYWVAKDLVESLMKAESELVRRRALAADSLERILSSE